MKIFVLEKRIYKAFRSYEDKNIVVKVDAFYFTTRLTLQQTTLLMVIVSSRRRAIGALIELLLFTSSDKAFRILGRVVRQHYFDNWHGSNILDLNNLIKLVSYI